MDQMDEQDKFILNLTLLAWGQLILKRPELIYPEPRDPTDWPKEIIRDYRAFLITEAASLSENYPLANSLIPEIPHLASKDVGLLMDTAERIYDQIMDAYAGGT